MNAEEVARFPAPGLSAPVKFSYGVSGRLAFLSSIPKEPPTGQNDSTTQAINDAPSMSRDLFCINLATEQAATTVDCIVSSAATGGNTEANLSREEKLQRERQRQLGIGVTSYIWSPVNADEILIPMNGNLYMKTRENMSDKQSLTLWYDKSASPEGTGPILDPQYSPDGQWISFVRDGEIYITSATVALQDPIQVTFGADSAAGLTNGLACFLTQEELDRYRGYFWSPDSTTIAFEQINDKDIPKFRIMHSGNANPTGPSVEEDHRYPFAGGPNPTRRLGLTKVRKSEQEEWYNPLWLEFPSLPLEDFYFSRIQWFVDGSLIVQRLNRLQTQVEVFRVVKNNTKIQLLLSETSNVWINSHYLLRFVEMHEDGTVYFIWGSEQRTGQMHLYLYSYTNDCSKEVRALTTGVDWQVESIEGIHDGQLYFTANISHPLERNLYRVPIRNDSTTNSPTRVTTGAGVHTVAIGPAGKFFVDIVSSLDSPPVATLYKLGTNNDVVLNISPLLAPDARLARLGPAFIKPSVISFPAPKDPNVTLYGALYRPDSAKFGSGPYPTMVFVYGGPHVQRVMHAWNVTADMRAQYWTSLGYAILKVDNRGSFRRGLAFEGAIKHAMGTIEVDDQVAGVSYAVSQGITDVNRVGIVGWSYGGYMSLMCLLKARDVFKLAISGAPVTSWDGYDSCYTERYMSLPSLNPTGYESANVMNFVEQMQGDRQKLLLVHGMIDENVHFRHTARLINALISARKPYDVLLFPNERHSPRGLSDRIYMEQRMLQYVHANL